MWKISNSFLIDPYQRNIPTDSGKWLNVNFVVSWSMKKVIFVIIFGLFFSNIVEAKLLELESCYQYNQEGGSKTYKDVYKEWDNETWEYYWQKKKGG